MNRSLKTAALLLASLAMAAHLTAPLAGAATFVTNAAVLSKGQAVTSNSSKNRNRTRFFFVSMRTDSKTKSETAFVQWALLIPKASAYKNGILIDRDQPLRLSINGVWFTITFDGTSVRIR